MNGNAETKNKVCLVMKLRAGMTGDRCFFR